MAPSHFLLRCAERKRRSIAERRGAVRLRLLAPRQRVQHHPVAQQHRRHQRDGHTGKSCTGGAGEGAVSGLWTLTEARFHTQAMSIYSTLAKPRAAAVAAAAEEGQSEKTEEPANQTLPSH